MNSIKKHEIKNLVAMAKKQLGTNKAVAIKCGVSEATISQLLNKRWDDFTDNLWQKIAAALDYNPTTWQFVATTNSNVLYNIFEDAKNRAMWLAVSHKAGSGKSSTSKVYASQNPSGVYLIQAREWNRKQFLDALCRTLGISDTQQQTSEGLIGLVTNFFHIRSDQNPLLIIDEADKLHPDALRVLIPIYNELEEKLGLVMMGTDNLERDINNGVKYKKKGYDEIYSRFGRSFIHLFGASKKDVEKICKANGITDTAIHRKIFSECNPQIVNIEGASFIKMIGDMRKLKRAIQRELLMLKNAA